MLKSQTQSSLNDLGATNDPRAQARITRVINAVINDADLANKHAEQMMVVKERAATALEEFAAHYTVSALSFTDMNDWIKASVINTRTDDRISLLITKSAILEVECELEDKTNAIMSNEGKLITKVDPFPLTHRIPEFKSL